MSKERSNHTSKPPSESMHACLGADLLSGKGEGRVCQKIGCGIAFSPKRKSQRFCCKGCRQAHFSLARKVGTIILEMISQYDARSGDFQPYPLLVSLDFPKLSIDLLDPFEDMQLEGLKAYEELSGDSP